MRVLFDLVNDQVYIRGLVGFWGSGLGGLGCLYFWIRFDIWVWYLGCNNKIGPFGFNFKTPQGLFL